MRPFASQGNPCHDRTRRHEESHGSHAQTGAFLRLSGDSISSARANSSTASASPIASAGTVVVACSGGCGACAGRAEPGIALPQAGQITRRSDVAGPEAHWAWQLGQRTFDGGMVSPADGPERTGSRRNETTRSRNGVPQIFALPSRPVNEVLWSRPEPADCTCRDRRMAYPLACCSGVVR